MKTRFGFGSLLLATAALAASPVFLSGDSGGGAGGGGGNASDAEPGTLADALKALKQAKTDLSTVTAARDTAISERDAAVQERDRLQGQFDSATQAANTAQTERDQARTERDQARTERDTERSRADAAERNVKNFESLAKAHGWKLTGTAPGNAVPSGGDPGGSNPREALVENLKNAKTPGDRGKAAQALREFDLKAKGQKEGK